MILALTHRSFAGRNNERLEFLGDAILNFVAGEALFNRFPLAREGQLSRLRARLVKGETLAVLARGFDLGDYLRLGSGELKSGGFRRESILADALEALIGAIYLDAGMEAAKERVVAWLSTEIESLTLVDTNKDPKTRVSYGIGRQLGDQLRDNPPPGVSLDGRSSRLVCLAFTRLNLSRSTLEATWMCKARHIRSTPGKSISPSSTAQ